MELTAKQYEIAVNNAAEISQVMLDIECGNYVLTMFVEVLQELLENRNISGATLVLRKLHEAAEVPFEQAILDESNIATWVTLFFETLRDIWEESVF